MEKLNLDEEERNGYLITTKTKELWKVQLDLLEKVIEICKKHNIKYFASYGTLLGTIRHSGYIPWDDDIDIEMLRNDYNKFMDIAIKELKDPYFIQCYKTEKNYHRPHIQIRNSNTTAIIDEDKYNNFNKGIFIDIFPIDNVPDEIIKRNFFKFRINLLRRILRIYRILGTESKLKLFIKRLIKNTILKPFNYSIMIEKYEKLVSKYKDKNTNYKSTLSFGYRNILLESEIFDNFEYRKFEYLKLPCPKEYHKILIKYYGKEYMIPIMQNSAHGNFFFDTKKSYKEYISK